MHISLPCKCWLACYQIHSEVTFLKNQNTNYTFKSWALSIRRLSVIHTVIRVNVWVAWSCVILIDTMRIFDLFYLFILFLSFVHVHTILASPLYGLHCLVITFSRCTRFICLCVLSFISASNSTTETHTYTFINMCWNEGLNGIVLLHLIHCLIVWYLLY